VKTHKDLHNHTGEYGIQGFPTIKLFGGKKGAKPIDYNGGRQAAEIVEWALGQAKKVALSRIGVKSSGGGGGGGARGGGGGHGGGGSCGGGGTPISPPCVPQLRSHGSHGGLLYGHARFYVGSV
jgi:hypothetical protein